MSRPDRQEHMHSDWGWCSLAAGNRGFCPGGIVDSYLDHSDKRVEGWSTVIHPTWGALLAPPRPRHCTICGRPSVFINDNGRCTRPACREAK